MPNRILRDWSDSYRFDGLSCEAECLFTRLIMKADDYGNFHGEERIVSALCFPLGDKMRISERLVELEHRGVIRFYESKGRKYLNITNFGQRLRTLVRKFPDNLSADCGHAADNLSADCGHAADNLSADCGHAADIPSLEEKRIEVEENRKELPVFSHDELAEQTDSAADPTDPGFSADFLAFWSAYPQKKEKRGAWRAWGKIKARPSVAAMVEAIRLQGIDRASARAKNEFYAEWKHPATWLADGCWEDALKYAAKKEKAPEQVPANWREILVGLYPDNFPDGMASGNFPSSFRFIEPSVQQEIRDASSQTAEKEAA